MTRFMLTSATLALMNAPALAQDTTSGDQQMRDTAIQSAQGAGLRDVRGMDGAIVLEASTSGGMPVLVVVGPAGEFLGLATPIAALGRAPATTTALATEGASAEPAGGEPADSGFMATQADPASPQMWDPAGVEGAMRSLELGLGGVAGEVPAQ